MFSLDAHITSAAEQDRVVRQRAVKEGAALFCAKASALSRPSGKSFALPTLWRSVALCDW